MTLLDQIAEPPGAPRPRRRGGLPALAALVALAVLLVAGAVFVAHRLTGSSADYAGPGSGKVTVHIEQGDTAADIGARLVAAGVVKSVGAFREAAKAEPRSTSVQPGYYELKRGMKASAALALLLDPASRLRGRVTIPEGMSLSAILERVARDTEVKLTELKAAAADPAALGLPEYAAGHLEGYLFPATYDVEPGTTAVQVLTTMVTRFLRAADDVGLEEGARALGRTPEQVVAVASLLEKEAKLRDDFPKVARVIYNRLAKGMPLQLDSTVNYVLKQRSGHLTTAQTRIESPYNTYRHTGLPPTPIDSPGQIALEAALAPAAGDWVYFITVDKSGKAAFTSSYQEFLQLKQQAQLNGVY
ncbi:MAG: hypothetical protein QOE64_2724 [Frankiales bacterium]|nr:hypothetical protein [Frankiales bacterium]